MRNERKERKERSERVRRDANEVVQKLWANFCAQLESPKLLLSILSERLLPKTSPNTLSLPADENSLAVATRP
jgi:hypothetical protein